MAAGSEPGGSGKLLFIFAISTIFNSPESRWETLMWMHGVFFGRRGDGIGDKIRVGVHLKDSDTDESTICPQYVAERKLTNSPGAP